MPRVSIWRDHKEMDLFLNEAMTCFHDENYDRNILSQYLYSRLAWTVHRAVTLPADNTDLPTRLRKAIKLIEKKFVQKISIDAIAREVGVSKPHLLPCSKSI
ncbi:MAG: helix-turn-helix transcriptional regulator [Lentisphaerae bacterium]|nr:helix-turn-helix transcriptional regulator [Lentisphaerota bacterium]MCP4099954.1 helix-turn-helix transcriptional regulator [Lentisphaerota bacterium]